MPTFCRYLSRASRDKILWGVDRETPGKQIQDFCLTFAPEVYREMRHLESLNASCVWTVLNWLHSRARVVEFMFGLAIAQNVLLLTRFSALHFDVEFLEYLFGTLQLCCSGTVFARHAMHNAFRGPRLLIKDTELIFLTVASAFSVLGLLVSPLYFCFHLLDIVNKSSDLQNVFKAVTLNGSSILLTAIFGGLVVWIYAIVGCAQPALGAPPLSTRRARLPACVRDVPVALCLPGSVRRPSSRPDAPASSPVCSQTPSWRSSSCARTR